MTMTEHEARMAELIESYNKAMDEEVVDKRKLDAIEVELKQASAEARKEKRNEVYCSLMKEADPMLEAARMFEFEYPSYVFTKEDGIETGVEPATKKAGINAAEFGTRLIKVSETKTCPYERVGVVKHGHSWEYRCEKLAYLLTYRTIKKYNGTSEDIERFKQTYAIRELAAKEKIGETPTSNSQICKLLQSIIDMLIYVPTDKGTNEVKARTCDVEFLLDMFVKHGRGAGVTEVLKGKKTKDYVFEVCHMIVTGKRYEVKYATKKENSSDKPVVSRKPVTGKKSAGSADEPKKANTKKAVATDTVVIPRPKKNAKAEAPAAVEVSDELPEIEEIPEIA